MTEKPILFNGEMVRAILDGRKTQTRRVIESPRRSHPEVVFLDHGKGWWPYPSDDGESENCDGMEYPIACPYGHPEDRLWVRETTRENLIGSESMTEYSAGGWAPRIPWDYSKRTRPSIHMPRKYCRLLLDVKSVRVERLNDISEEDARAEGMPAPLEPIGIADWKPVGWFRTLWDSINEKRGFGWDSNPYVFVIDFKRVGT